MKLKYLKGLFALLLVAATASCSDEQGTFEGNDSLPKITIFQYVPSLPNNPDNDTSLRFAANSQTTAGYYLAELTADRDARVAQLGEAGYADYVVSNGTQLAGISGASTTDVMITDLMGEYTITAVAVSGAAKVASSVTFTGLQWADVVAGTYYFEAVAAMEDMEPVETMLQICTTNSSLYRFKDVFATGYHLKINLLPNQAADEDGVFTMFRVPAQPTPYEYGSYGAISLRDIGYWQGSDSFVTNLNYCSGMYEDYYCFISVQYFVSAGSLGYGYDYFVPAE